MKRKFGMPRAVLAAALAVLCGGVCPSFASETSVAPRKISNVLERQIEAWCRALRDRDSSIAYASLSSFAQRKNSGELGLRAALALGYHDYVKGRYPEAQRWLDKAIDDPILREYSLFWDAQTARNRDNDRAIELLEKLQTEFPESVIHDLALQALAETELAAGQAAQAAELLSADPATAKKPDLLFLRAQAQEQANRPELAATDYLGVMYRFPTSEHAREARMKAEYLQGVLQDKFPAVTAEQKLIRADTLFAARYWLDAYEEYTEALPQLAGADHELAQLRIVQCHMTMGGDPSELANLKIEDPELDAERLLALAQAYRSRQQEPEMLAAVDQAVQRAPQSRWAEQALFAAGNYYWVQLDREKAASYYQRVADNYPTMPDADAAQWRVAWVAYLERRPEAVSLLETHLERYPSSSYTPDALYWLGRAAEGAGNPERARAFYAKLDERFPNNYFQQLGHKRLQAIGAGKEGDPEVLAAIPTLPPVRPMGDLIPDGALAQEKRAEALRSIAFDSSAEAELQAAYVKTMEPRLLLGAAEEWANAKSYGAAIGLARQVCPQIESRRFESVDAEIWRTAYPLPYAAELRSASAHAGVDPMLVAGLVRQESTFNPNAVSSAGAYGLMQLLPTTARKLARQMRVHYAHSRLIDADYNARLGAVYLAGLRRDFGSTEAALAAYNAGEDRVVSWQAGQNYRETAEFVESIPFTETRDYVQIVMRNTAIYRRVYGGAR
jgi:soluble lytic murein transglycosylase